MNKRTQRVGAVLVKAFFVTLVACASLHVHIDQEVDPNPDCPVCALAYSPSLETGESVGHVSAPEPVVELEEGEFVLRAGRRPRDGLCRLAAGTRPEIRVVSSRQRTALFPSAFTGEGRSWIIVIDRCSKSQGSCSSAPRCRRRAEMCPAPCSPRKASRRMTLAWHSSSSSAAFSSAMTGRSASTASPKASTTSRP